MRVSIAMIDLPVRKDHESYRLDFYARLRRDLHSLLHLCYAILGMLFLDMHLQQEGGKCRKETKQSRVLRRRTCRVKKASHACSVLSLSNLGLRGARRSEREENGVCRIQSGEL